jgi:hypothetical protein
MLQPAAAKSWRMTGCSSILPSARGVQTLLVASDQEHRFAAINHGIPADMFQPPFLVTKVLVTD